LEGDFARSRARVSESLAQLVAIDGPRGGPPIMARNGLGSLALAEGRPDEARAVFAAVLRDVRPDLQPGLQPTVSPGQTRQQLCLFGILAAAEGRPARAARLLAAGSAGLGRPASVHTPDVRIESEDALARARAELGEAAFNAAWAEGQAMSLEEAVADALADAAATA
jgi:hypothetical protein